MKILVTGSAGFIGFHLVERLLELDGLEIFGLDNLNDYYDVSLKEARLAHHGLQVKEEKEIVQSAKYPNYHFVKVNLADGEFVGSFMEAQRFDYVVNLAAQAGVRYSIENPRAYTSSNIEGFLNILEGCRHTKVKHLVYASTSSVYGLNGKMPLEESGSTQHPISLYSATKKANEMMAHTYSHLYDLPTTGLRFFTVYGPWGRPDMAIYLFTNAIFAGETIKVFNHGDMIRDFTYVGDIVESVKRVIFKPAEPSPEFDPLTPKANISSAPYRIFNIGNSSPISLKKYISTLEELIGVEAKKHYMELQPGDVLATHADCSLLENYIDYKPSTTIKEGLSKFVDWYRDYYQV